GVASMLGPLQCFVNSNSSRCAATAANTSLAASFPAGKVDAANTLRTTTPEYMCQGCECRRSLIVTFSGPAVASVSSGLPNAFPEKGQVGSRNTSNMRGPFPQVSGSAYQLLVVWVMSSISALASCNGTCPPDFADVFQRVNDLAELDQSPRLGRGHYVFGEVE